MHMCRGNMNAFWGGDGGYEPVAEAAFNMSNIDAFLLEYDTPRAGDFTPLRHVPKDKQILLGIVSTKDARIESKDALKRRVDEAAGTHHRHQRSSASARNAASRPTCSVRDSMWTTNAARLNSWSAWRTKCGAPEGNRRPRSRRGDVSR